MNVDNLRLFNYLCTYDHSSDSNFFYFKAEMKNWKTLVFKITLLVLIGIVIFTG